MKINLKQRYLFALAQLGTSQNLGQPRRLTPPLIDSSTQLVNAIVEKEVRRINYDANRVNVANNIVPIVITILLLTMVIVSYRLSDRASEAIAAPIKKLLKENKDLADGNFTEIPAVGDD